MVKNCLLVNLTLSCPSGWRKSKEASNVVYQQYHCDAKSGDFKKKIWGDSLDEIKSFQAKIRKYHELKTFPWMDSGFRIITAKNVLEYYTEMNQLKIQLDTLIDEFCQKVSQYKQELKVHLGSLYRENDYVNDKELRDSIGMNLSTMQLPGEGDFRIEISDTEKQLIEDRIKNSMESALQNSMKDAWDRIKSAIKRISTGCSDGGRVSKNMITSLSDVLESVKGFNLTNDTEIESIVEKASQDLTFYTSDMIMNSDSTRKDVREKANAILDKIQGW